jgi:serine acetyltransferase
VPSSSACWPGVVAVRPRNLRLSVAEETATERQGDAASPAKDEGTVRGMSFDEAKAIEELPPSEYRVGELIWSDYLAAYAYKKETPRARAVMFLPRMLTNSSMHANVLVRLVQGSPLWMVWFWRRLLIALHACDFEPHGRIGPGLRMPHPAAIFVGHSVLGRDVVLQHNITISAVTTNWRSGKNPGLVEVGDEVIIYPGAIVAGRLAIGDGAVVGANAFVVRDVPSGHIVIGSRSRPATEAERLGT